MKKKIIMMFVLGIIFQASFLESSVQSGGQNFVEQMKSFGESVKDMVLGMGSMFGVVPAGYQCNWEIINDTDQEIDIYYQNFIEVMGGFFQSNDSSASDSLHAIQPYSASFGYKPIPAGTVLGGPASSSGSSKSQAPTSGLYSGVKYYFALFMGYSPAGSSLKGGATQGTNFYKEYQLNLGIQGDNSINYYHIYTGKRFVNGNATHMIMAEMAGAYQPDSSKDDAKSNIAFSSNLGQVDPSSSSAPAGSVYFYNTTSQQVQLTVTLSDGTKYLDIPLEPLSYNLLSCPLPITMNGSTVAFAGSSPFKTITIPAMTVQGNNYIFEIYQDVGQSKPNVAIQGFSPGNYDICVSSNMRDISPQKAILWIESVEQKNTPVKGQKAPTPNPTDYDLPGQVWMVYQTPSVTTMQKAVLAHPTALTFIRPSLAEQIGYIYFIYVNTQNDDQAKKFISNFLSGAFGSAMQKQAIATINTAIDITKVEKTAQASEKIAGTIQDQLNTLSSNQSKISSGPAPSPIVLSNQVAQQVLTGKIPANSARLQDSATNLTGYLLGVDVFTPFAGTACPISYYQLTPATMSLDILAGVLGQYLDANKVKTAVSAAPKGTTQDTSANTDQTSAWLNPQIASWFNDYIKDPQSVSPKIVTFLSAYGSSGLFDAKGALTKGGQQRVNSFVNGLVSFANPPILYSPVSIQSPASTPPTNMPGAPAQQDTTSDSNTVVLPTNASTPTSSGAAKGS